MTMAPWPGEPHFLPGLFAPQSQENKKHKILVAIFQRGAADGLNMVVPFFEKRYYDVRPEHRRAFSREDQTEPLIWTDVLDCIPHCKL